MVFAFFIKPDKKTINRMNKDKIFDYLKEHGLSQCKKFISHDYSSGIVFNKDNSEILLITKKYKKKSDRSNEYRFYKCKRDEIMESEIIIDNQSIYKVNRGSQILGATIGSLALGGAGAIIGGLSGSKIKQDAIKSVSLKIMVDDVDYPVHNINFLTNKNENGIEINNGYSKDDIKTKSALNNIEEWHGIMEVLIRQQSIKNSQ